MTLDAVNALGKADGDIGYWMEEVCPATALFTVNGAGARAVGVRNGKGKANRVLSPLQLDMFQNTRHITNRKAGNS
jgi:hypothetical protein